MQHWIIESPIKLSVITIYRLSVNLRVFIRYGFLATTKNLIKNAHTPPVTVGSFSHSLSSIVLSLLFCRCSSSIFVAVDGLFCFLSFSIISAVVLSIITI